MNNFGYYGKTPQRGDFVRFNLPQLFVNVWDDWLQSVLISAERQYTEQWPTIYNAASSYNFALSPGVAGNVGWVGYVSTSEDKVGRRFPFCIAAAVSSKVLPVECHYLYGSVLDEMAALFAQVNTHELDLDQLQTSLAELSDRYQDNNVTDVSVAPIGPSNSSTDDTAFDSRANNTPSDMSPLLTVRLLDDTLMKTVAPYSVWCSAKPRAEKIIKSNSDDLTGERDTAVTYVTTGMPTPENGISLFSNSWNSEADIAAVYTDEVHDLGMKAALDSQFSEPDTIDQTANTQLQADRGVSVSDHDSEHTVAKTKPSGEPNQSEQLSTGDWSELETSEDVEIDAAPNVIVKPTVEPLILEDDTTTAPWEN